MIKEKRKLINQISKKVVLLVLWNIFVALVLVEIVLTVLNPADLFYRINIDSTGGEFTLSSNMNLIYLPKPNAGEFNAHGYRGEIFPIERKEKKIRILFLGDSVVEGLKIDSKKRFTEILNQKLSDNYEILNLGVPGYNFLQEMEYLKEKGIKYKPDYIIFGITSNDLSPEGFGGELPIFSHKLSNIDKGSFYEDYYKLKNKIENNLFKFHTYRYLKYFTTYRKTNDPRAIEDSISNEIDENEMKDLLDELEKLSLEYDFKFSFLFLPINTYPYQMRIFKKYVLDANITFFDLDDYTTKKFEDQFKIKLFLDDKCGCHLNEKGHEIVADLIYQNFNSIVMLNQSEYLLS